MATRGWERRNGARCPALGGSRAAPESFRRAASLRTERTTRHVSEPKVALYSSRGVVRRYLGGRGRCEAAERRGGGQRAWGRRDMRERRWEAAQGPHQPLSATTQTIGPVGS